MMAMGGSMMCQAIKVKEGGFSARIRYYFYSHDRMKDNKSQLRNVRVLRRNMLFVQSYDDQITHQMLTNSAGYSTCGTVSNLKTKQNYKNVTAYVTYNDPLAAAVALVAFYHLGSRAKVLFGTVQYCKFFMRKAECRNDYCVFLHVRDKKNEIIVNDEISDQVYLEHYAMALEAVREEEFSLIGSILAESEGKDEDNLVIKGLRRAKEQLKINLMPRESSPDGENSFVQVKAVDSTTESTEQSLISQLTPEKEVPPEKRSSSRQKSMNRQAEAGFNMGDFIKIRLIKKLVRENSSKFYGQERQNGEQIKQRGKMILYQIVKN